MKSLVNRLFGTKKPSESELLKEQLDQFQHDLRANKIELIRREDEFKQAKTRANYLEDRIKVISSDAEFDEGDKLIESHRLASQIKKVESALKAWECFRDTVEELESQLIAEQEAADRHSSSSTEQIQGTHARLLLCRQRADAIKQATTELDREINRGRKIGASLQKVNRTAKCESSIPKQTTSVPLHTSEEIE